VTARRPGKAPTRSVTSRTSVRRKAPRRTVVATRPNVCGKRVATLGLALLVGFGMLSYRLADLQLTPDPELQEGLGTRVITQELPAPRGEITDRWERPISHSLPAITIEANPRAFTAEQLPSVVARLSELVDTPPGVLMTRLSRDSAFAYIARQVDEATAEAVRDLEIPGIWFRNEPRRTHPNGPCSGLAIVGRTDIDHVGISGLEEAYDSSLTGVPGSIILESSADGESTIPNGEQVIEPAQPGQNVRTTLDRNVQYQTEQILAEAVEGVVGQSGIAIVMIPETGEIIAAANVQRNSESGVIECTTTNLAAIWTYEPGSIIKPLTMAAVLEANAASPQELLQLPEQLVYNVEGGTKIYRDYFAHTETQYTLTDVMALSSNIGTIELATRLGADGLYNAFQGFGLGNRTALEFKGEASGILDPLDSHVLELSNAAIGQSIAVTGLQMLQGYNTIANGGVHVDPVLLTDDVGLSDPHRVVSEETSNAVLRMMAEVVARGTGTRAVVPGYEIAGKTGTSWQPCATGGYLCDIDEEGNGSRHYAASFGGIISNDHGPQLSIIVIIDDPTTDRYGGGAVAAPAFAEIAGYAVRQLQIAPSTAGPTGERVRADPAGVLETAGGSDSAEPTQ
jgi:cell division protein FtsI (penicillin-binding protein 3)